MPQPDLLPAFLDDIVAHPEEPSLWLILADWLDEQGDPRAEMIRLHWMAQYEPGHREWLAREARIRELLRGGMLPIVPGRSVGGIEFAWIPPGSFAMGSPADEDGHSERERQHRVTLTRGYFLGIHLVTQNQWQAVMGSNPSAFSRGGMWHNDVRNFSDAGVGRFPVDSISWVLAREFCEKLTERLGRRFDLPTEAQWEWACRGGMRSPLPFHFGQVLNGLQANCDGRTPYGGPLTGPYLSRTTMVGSFAPNIRGLYDLHGNLMEWCRDAYRVDPQKLGEVDPVNDPATANRRVLRGGCLFSHGKNCRTAARHDYTISDRSTFFGLRLVVA